MRKEIIGIFCFFLVIFTLISLLSFSPNDPSIHNAKAGGEIHNLFGLLGAHLAGILIGLFGLGAFWIPLLLLLTSIHFFGDHPLQAKMSTLIGGIALVVITGSLLAMRQDTYLLFGSQFSAGGLIGLPLKSFLIKYTNFTGALIILILLWIVGFILSTGFSLIAFCLRCWDWISAIADRIKTIYLKWKERRERSRKFAQVDRKTTRAKAKKIKIKAATAKPMKPVPTPKQEEFKFMKTGKGFQLPSINFLEEPEFQIGSADNENLRMQSQLLEKKLEDFGVQGRVVEVAPGPVVTTFEYEPAPGVKINKIVNLTDDLALAMRATSIRIVAPIPGKAVIGIEVPNTDRHVVKFKEIIASSVFEKSKSKLT
ncbi:MAG: DNA translocase FtsK 4TM domain-containing protein, partial [Deltaproteobacteria bacterium]|nr:DNA translocase FtsK 4TM domain-containing protein [Deltaproteobacteria bacterium]